MKSKTRRIQFFDQFNADRKLVGSDSKGRPALWQGSDSHGSSVLIRHWPRKRTRDDHDLEGIWRSEIRQIHSLAALSQASDLLPRLVASGQDADGFYLAIATGDTAPLEIFLNLGRRPVALTAHRLPHNRSLLWNNFRRLVEGIDLLHSQATIHRNIDPWAVLTNFSSEPDFKLTGFEWSMRISETAGDGLRLLRTAPRVRYAYSFRSDWADLAFLIARILEIPTEGLTNMQLVPSAVTDHTSATEVRLLRYMLDLIPVSHIDGDFIKQEIDEIILSYSGEASRRDAHLYVALSLGQGSKLTDKIRKASGRSIDVTETAKQIDFVANDLGESFLLASRKAGGDKVEFLLCGSQLNYRLKAWQQPGTGEPETWDFAQCEDADVYAPEFWQVINSSPMRLTSLDFIDKRDAKESFPRLRGRSLSWHDPLKLLKSTDPGSSEAEHSFDAIRLLFLLELAYAASNIFPIEIRTEPDDSFHGDIYRVTVRSVRDLRRERLSDALNIHPPAKRLSRIIDSGEMREENACILLSAGELGESVNMTQWRIVGLENQQDGTFELEGTRPPQLSGTGFLAFNQAGTVVQLKRRLGALGELGKHSELLGMLSAPRDRIEDSQDKLDEKDEAFANLDRSKQKALAEIFSTIPLFLLQGPPGVGKTYVVSEIVRRRMQEEPTSRFLLTAQSNSAIDHLMDEITPLFADQADPPMTVRARSVEDDRKADGVETDYLAKKIIDQLVKSPLFGEGSDVVRERIAALAADYGGVPQENKSKRKLKTSSDRRALESMILRSANLVFATTNSAAVETLIQDKGLFDWSIVEEAGKATGSELISPMLLSHRRLMIGDHKQLPPFDSERIVDLLKTPSQVKDALSAVREMISRELRDATLDELLEDINSDDESYIGNLTATALRFLTLFGTLVDDDIEFLSTRSHLRPIARRLNEQHRMHPAISKLVSQCFYGGELQDYAKRAEKFRMEASPVSVFVQGREIKAPVVFIDLPYSRAAHSHKAFQDSRPSWHNQEEIEAVVQVLASLRANRQQPSLAVLSPYMEQVRRIKSRLRKDMQDSKIDLSGFGRAIGDEFCGTVDSFQGGQADCVLVSLVRNNEHTNPDKALGFLTRSNRMNVLLSRAKSQLVLVGSLSFFEYVLSNGDKEGFDLTFLRTLMTLLKKGDDPDVAVIPFPFRGK
ncbi:AAA domain-containing protein [Mesorhizobium sp. M1182]|uniref:AAA domain-containing protein n=1 Tax=Mesorhizobium sp. M1182 TaxID=2957067 RepID=UPI003335D9FC